MHLEVEQKFRLPNPSELVERLQAINASLGEPQSQADQYFAHPARDFAKTDEALRIRRVGEANYVTYKGPKLDPVTKTRHELEIPLPPGEATAKALAEMLVALSFRSVAEVRKRRRTAKLDWHGRLVEVALDEVEGIGTFVELETSADQSDLEPAKECLASLAKQLGLSDSERRSYLEMLLSKAR